jgi:hypothetical protein
MWETRRGQLSGSSDDERRIDVQHLEVRALAGARAGIDFAGLQKQRAVVLVTETLTAAVAAVRRGLAIDDDSIPFAVKVRREE